MKLYNSIGPNPRIVRMFMAEKGIEMPKQAVDLRGGENRQAEHLKRNPHGQMPALELDNGSYLSEVTAICEYLEEKNPKPPLIGATPEEQRRMPDVDTARRSQHLRAARQRLSFQRRPARCSRTVSSACRKPHPDLKKIAADRIKWLDGQMAGKEYLCGKRFSLADILLYCAVDFGNQVGQPLDPANTNIAAWFARVGARPSVKA